MLTVDAVSDYVRTPTVVIIEEGLTGDNKPAPTAALDRLAHQASTLAKGRVALKEQNELFDQLYRRAEQADTSPQEIEEAARIILEEERHAADTIVPQIEKLERNLAKRRPPTSFARAARRAAEEALDIGQTWLELYQAVRIRLLKLASDRRAAAGESGSAITSDPGEMESYLRRTAEQ